MKKLFPDKNIKNLVSGAAILLVISFIVANPFITTLSSFAAPFVINKNFCDTLTLSSKAKLQGVNLKATCHKLVDGLNADEINLMQNSEFQDKFTTAINSHNQQTIEASFQQFCTDANTKKKLNSKVTVATCKAGATNFQTFLNSLNQNRVSNWPTASIKTYVENGAFTRIKDETGFFSAMTGNLKTNLFSASTNKQENQTLQDYLYTYKK